MVQNKIGSLSVMAMTLLMSAFGAQANSDVLANAKQAGQINFGYLADEAPYSSLNEKSGEPTGYAIDLCNKVAESIKAQPGYGDMKVVYHPTQLNEGLQQVAEGELDLLCGAAMETLTRREQVSFSTPIGKGGLSAVINENASADLKRVLEDKPAHTGPKWRATVNRGLANHTYVVHEGTVTEAWVRNKIKQLGVVATVVTAKTHDEGVKLVSEGLADAYFADRFELIGELHHSHLSNVELSPQVFEVAYGRLALPKNNDDFRLLIDRTLSELYQSDDFVPMYTQYFGKPTKETLNDYQGYNISQ
ncbi:amino acid ABC transporter substrate-binding protein [Vibrio aestuarianus]|uniref:amino acid ABC transporter substrate-binding protein n=1 Tax=Vibrio aestuarianus TaxID=28171 RepID=UPI00237CFCD4|nr:amino acid ABC transporter substrate-binding protein [Vibrio aestuarianus]MDE1328235.1 amino acid ABC transporter substrate-binding protein [Vibrio aestuarianus]